MGESQKKEEQCGYQSDEWRMNMTIASNSGQDELTQMSEWMTSQARPAAVCSWLSVLCIESTVVQSRTRRLAAGMHSTSFVLGKGVGCRRLVFCVLVSNIDRLLVRAWCLLSAAFAVNSRHRTAAFTAIHRCFVDRRDEAAEAAGMHKIAKSSGDSATIPRTKGKEFFSRVTQWRLRSCELQKNNRSHQPCGLCRFTCR